MFKKRGSYEEKIIESGSRDKEHEKKEPIKDIPQNIPVKPLETAVRSSSVNKILKGSKLTGDINVTCDLEVSGDVDGNITAMQESNILIKGVCKGNIETKEGSVDIEGELQGGNITAGKDVRITGKFKGGEINAKSKIFINGEFSGKLEGNEIEIGANSSGKGEIFYKEYISISKGAKVDVSIAQAKHALKEIKTPPKSKTVDTKPAKKSVEEK